MIYTEIDLDREVRLAAFSFLSEQILKHGKILPWSVIGEGFIFKNIRVHLVSQQGIFKPKILTEFPLSIRSAPQIPGKPRPYDDQIMESGKIRYRYYGADPNHPDNVGLRLAMNRGVPLIYFYGVEVGRYEPVWPVFVVDDHPDSLTFDILVGDQAVLMNMPWGTRVDEDFSRRYRTVEVQQRLHQDAFRWRVLRAYQNTCTICRLKHPELLEAAHILEDKHPSGIPAVNNGLAMCAIHHKAFDSHILGIRPDYFVEIREDVLHEKDGPMLLHGLQGFQGKIISLPRRKNDLPDRERLEEKYARFKSARP